MGTRTFLCVPEFNPWTVLRSNRAATSLESDIPCPPSVSTGRHDETPVPQESHTPVDRKSLSGREDPSYLTPLFSEISPDDRYPGPPDPENFTTSLDMTPSRSRFLYGVLYRVPYGETFVWSRLSAQTHEDDPVSPLPPQSRHPRPPPAPHT